MSAIDTQMNDMFEWLSSVEATQHTHREFQSLQILRGESSLSFHLREYLGIDQNKPALPIKG